MRILTVGNMYPPHHLGGYEITWRSSVEHLRAAGHRVSVLTTDFVRAGVSGGDEPGVSRELRWYWRDHRFPRLGLGSRIALERHNAEVLDRHLGHERPDAVCWWAMGGMSLGLVERVRRRGLPAAGVVGDDWMVYGPKVDAWLRVAGRGGFGSALARAAGLPASLDLSRSALWLFNSERTRAAALETGLDPRSARVANPGIDTRLFAPAAEHPWEWRLACVGRIDPRKGLTLAVEALAELPQARLRLAGAGDDRHASELLERARALGVSERFELREAARSEVAEVYGAADAVLFPVLWEEPWGLAPLEAMACGRPVIASGHGGSAEYLRDGENCLISPPEDGGAGLARALERLAGDERLRARLREGGLATSNRFTEQSYNERIEVTLDEVAGRRAPSPGGPP